MLSHPEVAFRDCHDCLLHVYDDDTGKRAEYPIGSGLPILRAKGNVALCRRGPDKCPKGHPAAGRELRPHNQAAYLHYLECKATGIFPDDPIVKQNAGVIRLVEDSIRRADDMILQQYLKGVAPGGR